jgi:hypothetical protein
MTVSELKAKLPEADVVRLDEGAKYIIRTATNLSFEQLEHLYRALRALGIHALVVPPGFDFFEIQESYFPSEFPCTTLAA